MNREKLEKEQAELKARLAELVDFINSEEYYKLPEKEKNLIATQRSGMEVYMSAVSIRLWGSNRDRQITPSSLFGLLTSMILLPNSSCPSYTIPNEAQKEQ